MFACVKIAQDEHTDQLKIQPRWGKLNTRHQMSSKKSSVLVVQFILVSNFASTFCSSLRNSYKMLTEDQLSIESFILKLNALSDCGSSLRWYPLFLNSYNPPLFFPSYANMSHKQTMHYVRSYIFLHQPMHAAPHHQFMYVSHKLPFYQFVFLWTLYVLGDCNIPMQLILVIVVTNYILLTIIQKFFLLFRYFICFYWFLSLHLLSWL